MIRRILTALMLSAVSVVVHAQAQAGSALDRVQQSAVLRACTTGDYKPFSYLRPDGGYEGIDIELVQSLAQSLGAHVEFVRTSWPTLTADFVAGKCDIAIGGVSVSLERQKKAAFSSPYLSDGKTPITRCENVGKYQTLADIDQPNVRVVVNPGGTNDKFAHANFKQAKITVFPDNVTIFDEIVAGRQDVMVTDSSETMMQHKLRPSLCSVHPDHPFQYGEKAFMLPREDLAFKDYVDQWLHLARASGEYDRIADHWLK